MKSKKTRKRSLLLSVLMGLAPLQVGSCDAFRDAFFTALESATGAALDAALTNAFDEFRGDN